MRFAERAAATICIIILFASSPHVVLAQTSTSATSNGPIPSTFFGISVLYLTSSSRSWPLNIPVGTLGKTQGTEWNDVEPSNGSYNWAPLDNSIAAAKSAGITTFVYTFWSTPAWASSDPSQSCILTASENVTGCAAPPAHINDWDSFVRALVTRYKGEIQYYELWNEGNLNETWSGSIGQMITLAQHAYDDIKSIDPSAVVIAPSVSRVGVAPYTPGCISSECWLADYFKAGGAAYADAIAYHPYACFDNESACAKLNVGCAQGDIQACAGSPLETEINDIRSLMATYDLSGKPLVATEGGLPSDIISENLLGTSEQQAAYVSRWFIIQASENVSTAVWFSEFPAQNGLAGFGTPSAGSATNQAYKQTYEWLVGSTTDGPCSLSGDGIWTCNLTLSSGSSAQIIFADSSQIPITYTPSAQYIEYQNLNGSIYQVNGSLGVGMEPLLLTGEITTSTSSSTNATSLATTVTTTLSSNSESTSSANSTSKIITTANATVGSISNFYWVIPVAIVTIAAAATTVRKSGLTKGRKSVDVSSLERDFNQMP